MDPKRRVFIFGAGFSKPAKMPLATELLSLVRKELPDDDEMKEWIDGLRERLKRLAYCGRRRTFELNIEQVFHYARFDIESHRLMQHLAPVGRYDGPETHWQRAEAIESWLSNIEELLPDVFLKAEERATLAPIVRWAQTVDVPDTVVTFNYDTLAERALSKLGKKWNHATGRENENGIAICKLHGSMNWLVADRRERFPKLDLLFDKLNLNRRRKMTGHGEDDCHLWRCRSRQQLRRWLKGRDVQLLPKFARRRTVGVARLGTYKEPHQIPGLGPVWAHAMRALYEADIAIVVGFSMSDYDAMAQMQFVEVAQKREEERHPLQVVVIDPRISEETKTRFIRVFRKVDFIERRHEKVNWNRW